ncbi:MAG: amino acid transporter [Nocardioidaceae bacterium]|nr:MAG: amino acid transporter [Nocardioidaceae bacterium]
MFHVATAGLFTGLSLIVAIGAQNAFVLRQGIRREHVGTVVATCAISDVVLIAAGVAGVGALVDRSGRLLDVVTWAGAAFLIWYGVTSLLRARHPAGLTAEAASPGRVAAKALALTWLNPHVYLDTVLLLGSVAATHGSPGRWWFGLGACLGSLIWFSSLGFGARLLAPLLARPRAWQIVDVIVACTMFAVAAMLLLG